MKRRGFVVSVGAGLLTLFGVKKSKADQVAGDVMVPCDDLGRIVQIVVPNLLPGGMLYGQKHVGELKRGDHFYSEEDDRFYRLVFDPAPIPDQPGRFHLPVSMDLNTWYDGFDRSKTPTIMRKLIEKCGQRKTGPDPLEYPGWRL